MLCQDGLLSRLHFVSLSCCVQVIFRWKCFVRATAEKSAGLRFDFERMNTLSFLRWRRRVMCRQLRMLGFQTTSKFWAIRLMRRTLHHWQKITTWSVWSNAVSNVVRSDGRGRLGTEAFSKWVKRARDVRLLRARVVQHIAR